MKVNQTQLAEILGKTDVTIWQWQKDGMPIAVVNTRGLSNEYDTAAVIAWLVDREVKKVRAESPRDALARAQTEMLEVQLAEKKGELVAVGEIEPGFTRLVVAARARVLQVVDLMRGLLEPAQATALEAHLREALQEIAHYDPSCGSTEAPGGAVGAAGEAGGGAVGGGKEAPQRQEPVPGQVQAVDHPVPEGAS